jgi:hypothetical protein
LKSPSPRAGVAEFRPEDELQDSEVTQKRGGNPTNDSILLHRPPERKITPVTCSGKLSLKFSQNRPRIDVKSDGIVSAAFPYFSFTYKKSSLRYDFTVDFCRLLP